MNHANNIILFFIRNFNIKHFITCTFNYFLLSLICIISFSFKLFRNSLISSTVLQSLNLIKLFNSFNEISVIFTLFFLYFTFCNTLFYYTVKLYLDLIRVLLLIIYIFLSLIYYNEIHNICIVYFITP